jgi:hypothetical protein
VCNYLKLHALTISGGGRDRDTGSIGSWLNARVCQDLAEKSPVTVTTNLTVPFGRFGFYNFQISCVIIAG